MHNEGYFDDPRQHRQAIEMAAGYSVSTCYINTCTTTVFIKDRSGIITEIEPTRHALRSTLFLSPSSLYIYQLHRGLTTSMLTWKDQYHECDVDFQTNAMHARASANVDNGIDGSFKMASGKISYKVSLSGSAINKKIIYNEDFDVLIIAGCNLNEAIKAQHPYSKVGRMEGNILPLQLDLGNENFQNNANGLFFQCRYVVNNLQASVQKRIYAVIADKHAFPIDSQENWQYGDGEIYVMYRGIKGELLTNCFESIEKANAAGLYIKFYASAEAAEAAVRESPDYQNSLRVSEIEAKATAAEVALRKAEQERDNIYRKGVEDKQRHAAALEELASERQSLLLESKQKQIDMGMKNTHDIIKYVPVLLTTILSLFTLLAKKK